MNTTFIIPLIPDIINAFLLLCIFIAIYKYKNLKNPEEEYVLALKILNSSIDIYKHQLNTKIHALQSKHNLNKDEQVNTIKLYNEEKNDLYKVAIRELYEKHFSKKVLSIIYGYQTKESLAAYVVCNLKGDK